MKQKHCIFASVLLSSFITPFLASSINVAVPAMATEFLVEPTQLSWVVTAFLLGAACALLPFGRASDILGRKKLFRIGTLFVLLTTLGAGLAPNASLLILLRFLQGISIALIFSTSMAMLVSSHAPSERGKVIGYSTAAVYIGLSLGPFLGGIITLYLGWRMIFFLTASILFGSWYMAGKIEGEWYGERGASMDYGGSVLYFLGTLSVLGGLSILGTTPFAPWLLGGGFLLSILFLWKQMQEKSPLLDIRLFRNVVFAMSNLASFLHYSSTFSISFLLSLYLQIIRGLDAVTAGSILLLQPIMMALLSPLAGSLSDKFQPRIVASAGMGLTAMGIFALSLLREDTPFSMVGAVLLLVGTGFAFFSSPNSNAIMSSVEPRQFGIASSVMSLMRILGQAMSMVLVTLLMKNYVLPELDPHYAESLSRGIRDTFHIFVLACCVGTFISMMRGKQK